MIPIQQLLSRIRWDKEFGSGSFEIGYREHVERKIARVPLKRIQFEEGNQFSFQLESEVDEMLLIPFHRVREVYRNRTLIWKRAGD